MRHFALQTLTWGTIAGTTASALWLASMETLAQAPGSQRHPGVAATTPAERPVTTPMAMPKAVQHLPRPAAHVAEPRPVVLLERGQPVAR